MEKKKNLLLLVLCLALLIVGASVLYTRLSEGATPDQLATLPQATTPTNPTQPTDPTNPTDPTQPTEPSEPTESSKPSEPAEPTEPTEPSEPAEPTDPTEPTNSTHPTEPTNPTQHQPTAPDFVVYDAQGNAVRLSDYFGKPIVLNFWASWCGPCQMEMPHFQEKFEALGEEVTFLMVNVTGHGNDTQKDAEALIQANGYTFPVFFDMDLDAAITYGVSSFPTTFFINAWGDPVAYVSGAIDAATLQRGIDMIKN